MLLMIADTKSTKNKSNEISKKKRRPEGAAFNF